MGKQISAGGIVYKRNKNNIIEVKLIFTKKWRNGSLPKGKIENNESFELCALREVQEESGVIAEIEDYLGEIGWKLKSGDDKIVHVFLMKCVKDGQPNDPDNEIIKAEWKTIDEAINTIDFIPVKNILLLAWKKLS